MLDTFVHFREGQTCSCELSDLPAAEAINFTNYLVLQTSDYTANQIHSLVLRLTTVLNSSDKQSGVIADLVMLAMLKTNMATIPIFLVYTNFHLM